MVVMVVEEVEVVHKHVCIVVLRRNDCRLTGCWAVNQQTSHFSFSVFYDTTIF